MSPRYSPAQVSHDHKLFYGHLASGRIWSTSPTSPPSIMLRCSRAPRRPLRSVEYPIGSLHHNFLRPYGPDLCRNVYPYNAHVLVTSSYDATLRPVDGLTGECQVAVDDASNEGARRRNTAPVQQLCIVLWSSAALSASAPILRAPCPGYCQASPTPNRGRVIVESIVGSLAIGERGHVCGLSYPAVVDGFELNLIHGRLHRRHRRYSVALVWSLYKSTSVLVGERHPLYASFAVLGKASQDC